MSKNRYKPDYCALYPDIEISSEIMEVLRTSDRKMEYMEYDLKTERAIKCKADTNPRAFPAREDSFERLLGKDQQFSSQEPTPEQRLLEQDKTQLLRSCLALLSAEEMALVRAIFFEQLPERKIAKKLAITQQAINKRKGRLLAKLREMMES